MEKVILIVEDEPRNLKLIRDILQASGYLTLEATDLAVAPANPGPGSTAHISTTLHNAGDQAVVNPQVAFYNGNPSAGGTPIGTVTATLTLAGGMTTTLGIDWTVPASGGTFGAMICLWNRWPDEPGKATRSSGGSACRRCACSFARPLPFRGRRSPRRRILRHIGKARWTTKAHSTASRSAGSATWR